MTERAHIQQCYAFFFVLLMLSSTSIQAVYMIFFQGNFPLALPLAFSLSVVCMGYTIQYTPQLLIFFRNISLLLASIFIIALPFPDFSYDGVWYHQPIANALAEGSNVFKHSVHSYWGDAYPKAVEIFAGELLRYFPSINAYMVINAMLAVGLWSYIHYFADSFAIKQNLRRIFSFFAVGSFVFVQLAYMHLVDYVLYSMMLYILLSLVLIFQNKATKLDYALFIFASAIVFSSKMSGGLFSFVAFCMLFVRTVYRQKSLMAAIKKCLLLGVPVALLGVVILGFNPYMTNLMAGKHILSPLAGENTDHIAVKEHPTNFTGKNRFEKLFISLTSETANMRNGEGDSSYKYIPFSVKASELIALMGASARVAGWGPYFLAALLLSCALPIFYTVRKAIFMPFMAFIALCVCLHPESWWARYGFYVYLLPLVVIFCLQDLRHGRNARAGKGLLCATVIVLALNLMGFIYAKYESISRSHALYSQIFADYKAGKIDICREPFDYKMSFHPEQLFTFYEAPLDKINGVRCFDGSKQWQNWYFTYTEAQ